MEGGDEKWAQWVRWLNTPPGGSPATTEARVPSRAEQIRAAAEASVGHEGAAFAAALTGA